MKDPIKESERNLKIVMAVAGLIILIAGLGVAIYDYVLEQKSISVTGKITAINYNEGKREATVAFRLTGHEYEAVVRLRSNKYAVDDKLAIKVDMYNPKKEIINNHYYIYVPLIFISIVVLILSLPYLLKFFKKVKYRSQLKSSGFFVNATITEVFLNNNEKLKKHGTYPYRLRAKYFNPQTQTEYVFESDDTYVNLNDPITEYQKTTVVVYLNQNDINNYFVDLDSLYPPLNVVDPIALMGPKTEIKFHFGTKKQKEWEEEQKQLREGLHSTEAPDEEQKEE